MMEDRLVTYKTACLAKEKGFPQSAMMYYEWDGFLETLTLRPAVDYLTARYPEPFTAAPTQSLLQQWLREEKGYYVYPLFDNVQLMWDWICRKKKGDKWIPLVGLEFHLFPTYELALEDALKYALEKLV